MSATTNATARTAADTIAEVLANHADGITVRALADAASVGASTTAKVLATMETAGTATRIPGASSGKGKAADLWRPTTPDATTDEAPTDTTPDATTDEAPTDTPDATTDEIPTDTTPDAPVSGAPVSAGPRQPDLKVLIMAGVLGGHPDGVSATDAVAESGLAPAVGDTILAAMEVVGAARRLPVDVDGIELWVRGDGDLSAVDPANAPTHVTCPTCGHARKVRRPLATGRRSGGGVRAVGEANSDGSQRLAKNGLRSQVEAFMRDLGPGHDVTPGTVARELGGRSSGAVANAMSRLTGDGVLVMISEAPVKYALADDAPTPTADVAAYMTRTDDETADEQAQAA